ncbi:5-bromo-4-chloroindolyl phosphate hydrolysis family protein [Oceaniglobus ichthyenteri]|uniref:5-bromo-4-chloroindolyl phosphate hydrolysis family protein n=1 Tax=Oceaniglobus ichthyenteri TaxID=2136177 RepID=UPI000D3D0DF7|nr:5-bromo-4-chloroindolyl phosphate hydrolysis family protein [Oceaniglobus ichthyenteri]
MAQRFGGKHSPDGPTNAPNRPQWEGKSPSRAGALVNALFVAPFPLVIFAFFKDPAGLAFNLVAFGILMLAAWLTREGVLAHEAFDARKVAKRPAIPRKLFGAVLTGLGLAVAGAAGGDLVAPVIFAGLGGGLHFLAFGADPWRDKGVAGVDQFQADRVARVVDEAEAHLKSMKDAILRAGDRPAETRVDRFIATARDMCRTVEEDPRDLTAARKFLGVYLLGARDATAKFADIYARTRDAKARADYMALLDDLEQGFAARTQKLLLEDRSDLDVEIEVLRDRLAREGLARGPIDR